jgi:hypothetical protein
MHASALLEEGSVADALREALSHLTWYDTPTFCGERILRTSYWLKSGSIIRDAFLDQALPQAEMTAIENAFSGRDPKTTKFSQSEEIWQEAAKRLGLPNAVPRSVASIKAVEQQRKLIIPMTFWDERLELNMAHILTQHGISRPGAYSPALLQGPTGASKTHSVLAAYSVLGIAVNIIDGSPSQTSDVRIDLITGGMRAKDRDFESYVKGLASMGFFQTQAARLEYYQRLSKASDTFGCDLVDAHERLGKEDWADIAKRDGYPLDSTSFSVHYPGRIRLGQHADMVNLIDEVNKFNVANQQEIRTFLSAESVRFGFNTAFMFTANPPSEEYQGRSVLGADIIGCCDRLAVTPRNADQYREYIASYLGARSDGTSLGKEVMALVASNNPRSPDKTAPTDLSSIAVDDRVPFVGRVLKGTDVLQLAERIGTLQQELENAAVPGGRLHPGTFGLQVDAPKPSVRSLSQLLSRFNDIVASKALESSKGHLDVTNAAKEVDGEILAEALSIAIEEKVLDQYTFERDGDAQIIAPQQINSLADNDESGNKGTLQAMIARAKLREMDLQKLFAKYVKQDPEAELKTIAQTRHLLNRSFNSKNWSSANLTNEALLPLHRYINEKTNGECIGVDVDPDMDTAHVVAASREPAAPGTPTDKLARISFASQEALTRFARQLFFDPGIKTGEAVVFRADVDGNDTVFTGRATDDKKPVLENLPYSDFLLRQNVALSQQGRWYPVIATKVHIVTGMRQVPVTDAAIKAQLVEMARAAAIVSKGTKAQQKAPEIPMAQSVSDGAQAPSRAQTSTRQATLFES